MFGSFAYPVKTVCWVIVLFFLRWDQVHPPTNNSFKKVNNSWAVVFAHCEVDVKFLYTTSSLHFSVNNQQWSCLKKKITFIDKDTDACSCKKIQGAHLNGCLWNRHVLKPQFYLFTHDLKANFLGMCRTKNRSSSNLMILKLSRHEISHKT